MKKNVILVVALFALMGFSVFAQDAESDFQVTKKGTGVVISDYVGKKTVVNIPSRIQNLPVIEIEGGAFSIRTSITSVTIPNGVTMIGSSAFSGCTNLTSVTIPNSVTIIEGDAFSECSKLTSITLPNSLKRIENDIFAKCTNLTSVTIPNSVTYIGSGAFRATGLTSVTIPNSVTNIGLRAFENCSKLTSVTFGGAIPSTGIAGANAFPGDLRDKYIASGIGTYTRQNGTSTTWTVTPAATTAAPSGDPESDFQITKTATAVTITKYVGTKTVVNIPSRIQNLPVNRIGNNAFENNKSITSVTIPSSVEIIGDWAFNQCYGITSVTFGGQIMSGNFSSVAFNDLGDLRNKFFVANAASGTAGTYTKSGGGSNATWTKK